MAHIHYCISGEKQEFLRTAAAARDNHILENLRAFDTTCKGEVNGGPYLTPSWRAYKRIWRQEAHRRGLS